MTEEEKVEEAWEWLKRKLKENGITDEDEVLQHWQMFSLSIGIGKAEGSDKTPMQVAHGYMGLI